MAKIRTMFLPFLSFLAWKVHLVVPLAVVNGPPFTLPRTATTMQRRKWLKEKTGGRVSFTVRLHSSSPGSTNHCCRRQASLRCQRGNEASGRTSFATKRHRYCCRRAFPPRYYYRRNASPG